MSNFAVKIDRIAAVWEHPNADRLSLARIASSAYQFVIAKGQFKPGDLVVYFPIDSLLPMPIVEALGLVGKLAHGVVPTDGTPRLQNRVKTVRLRGEISQGVVAAPEAVLDDWTPERYTEGDDITEKLGVTKFEPPIAPSNAGNLAPLPPSVAVYDLENAENAEQIVNRLMGIPCLITEKLEGSHFAITIDAQGEIAICQRRYRIVPIEGKMHDWIRAAQAHDLPEKLKHLRDIIRAERPGEQIETVTVRGEIVGIGIQGNYYGLSGQDVFAFEIEVNGVPLDATAFMRLTYTTSIRTVPILAHRVRLADWCGHKSIAEASNGMSSLNPDKKREGVVVRPMYEIETPDFGRVIIKQRSPDYLASSSF